MLAIWPKDRLPSRSLRNAGSGAPLARAWSAPLAVFLLCSCATPQSAYLAPDEASLGIPGQYNSLGTVATEDVGDLADWWTRFNDPLLDQIVTEAIESNLDVKAAVARLRQAREQEVQAKAGALPGVTASGSATQSTGSDSSDDTSFSLGLDADYEADIFGGVSASIAAAKADTEVSAYDLSVVRISLIGDVARYYTDARSAQQRLLLAQETLEYAEDNLQIACWRRQAGLVSSLDVEQARGLRAQAAADIPLYRSAYLTATYRLGILTGQAPAALIADMRAVQEIPVISSSIAVGIPANTLRQRPDIRSAERSLAASVYRIGVERADLYPSFNIGGNIGADAVSIGGLADAVTGALFASLGQIIFDGGRARSEVRAQEAAADAALANYQQTILLSLEEVENALTALEAATEREAAFVEAADAARNQAILARLNYRSGISDFAEVLDAETALVTANDGLISSRTDSTLSVIQLYRSLGGGWEPAAEGTQG